MDAAWAWIAIGLGIGGALSAVVSLLLERRVRLRDRRLGKHLVTISITDEDGETVRFSSKVPMSASASELKSHIQNSIAEASEA